MTVVSFCRRVVRDVRAYVRLVEMRRTTRLLNVSHGMRIEKVVFLSR